MPGLHRHGLFVGCCSKCKGGAWASALASTSAFEKAISCPDEKVECMRRMGSDEDFFIRSLRCCVKPTEVPGVEACLKCTMEFKLPRCDCDYS
jgi:hypothetical protein